MNIHYTFLKTVACYYFCRDLININHLISQVTNAMLLLNNNSNMHLCCLNYYTTATVELLDRTTGWYDHKKISTYYNFSMCNCRL